MYKRYFESTHSYKEILILCKYLKNYFKMDFVVIGGAAFGLYTQSSIKDLDIVVYDFGTLNEFEVDRVIVKSHDDTLMKIEFKGVEIDLLRPGQIYKEDNIPIFKIPNKFSNIEIIDGIKVISKEDLIKSSKQKDKEFRANLLK